jgi:tetratricopeptide (TPR) repeat protein
MEALSKADPGDLGHRHWLAMSYLQLGRALAAAGRIGEALPSDERAVAIAEDLYSRDPQKSEAESDVAETRAQTAAALLNAGDAARAAEYAARPRAIYDELSARDPDDVTFSAGRAEAYELGGDIEAKLAAASRNTAGCAAHWRAALGFYRNSLRIWTGLRGRGMLAKPDAGKPQLLAHRAAICELALR